VDDLEYEILRIIEEDKEINIIIEQLSNNDCGCDDDSSALEWGFPVLCTLLFPIFIFSFALALISHQPMLFIEIMARIGLSLNCFWNIVPTYQS